MKKNCDEFIKNNRNPNAVGCIECSNNLKVTGLEMLSKIKKLYKNYVDKIGLNVKDILGFDLCFAHLEKELKALEIINEKGLPLGERDMILHSKDYEEYTIKFSWANFKNISIQKAKEEFKILKETLHP